MENTKIVESQRKTDIQNREIELFKNGVVIVPYQVSGFLDYSNRGIVNYQINPADAETFKRVWTGNDACCLNWKNSLYLVQNSETKKMEYHYQLGEVFIGTVETNYQENRVMKDESFSEYTKQDIRTSVTFRVDADRFKLNDYNLLMFYKLPEIYGSTLFRIENMERDFIGNRLVGYVITFVSVNQDFANTGRARQQNIMPNAPGQGYLECIVKDKNWPQELGDKFKQLVDGKDYYKFYDRYITADLSKSKHNGATKVIVKCFGNCFLKSFTMTGRPVNIGDDINVSTSQRILFPINFKEVSTPTLFRTQSNSSNFYFGNVTPTLQYYKELKEFLNNVFSPINQWKYQGWLNYDYDKMKSTNPLNSGGNYSYTIYGWINQDNIVKDWIFNVESTTINTSGIYGVATKYIIGGEKAIHDHLFDNFWSEKNVKLLPIEKQNTMDFGPTLMSMISTGIGKVFSGALSFDWISVGLGTALSLIGIVGVLATKLAPQKLATCRGIINAALLDFNNDLFNGGGKMPFNMLDNNDSNDTPNSVFFDGSTLNTCFEADITDLFTSDRLPDKVLSTENIGQKTYEDGTNILENGKEFLLNGDAKLTLPGGMATSGYIIDGFKLCAIFNGEISVEFKNAFGDVIWSGIYQSEGKWTKSMREIWTEKSTSVFGRENVFYNEPVPYPKPIDLLDGLNIQFNNIKFKEEVLSNNDWIVQTPADNLNNYTPGAIISWGWLPLRSNLWPDGYNSNVYKVYKYDEVITNKEDFIKKFPILQVSAYVEANNLYCVSNHKYTNKSTFATVKIDLRKINLGDFEITFNPNSCNSNTVLNKIRWGNDDGAGLYNFNTFKKINVFMRDYWYENGQKVNGISLQFATIPEDTNLQTIIDNYNMYKASAIDFTPKIATIYGGLGAPKPRGKIGIGYEFEFISEQNI